ncbi:MAG: hypothetical protein ACLTDC_09310 [Lachnospiraceae bacterium]
MRINGDFISSLYDSITSDRMWSKAANRSIQTTESQTTNRSDGD